MRTFVAIVGVQENSATRPHFSEALSQSNAPIKSAQNSTKLVFVDREDNRTDICCRDDLFCSRCVTELSAEMEKRYK